jgi:hypothetical protein
LELALKDNLHQAQYVERLQDLASCLVRHNALTMEQLASIWNAQRGQHRAVVSNVQELLSRIAWFLSPQMLEHLLLCFRETWGALAASRDARRMQESLEFILKLARDDREGNMAKQVLEVLWACAHEVRPTLQQPLFFLDILQPRGRRGKRGKWGGRRLHLGQTH